MTIRYATEAEKDLLTGKTMPMKCKACERIYLYRDKDRVTIKNKGGKWPDSERFIVCPCGVRKTLALGGCK